MIFTVTRTLLPTWDDTQVVIQPLNGAPRTLLVDGGADARYIPTGHIVYMRRGVLLAAPFDLAQRRVTGGGVAVVPDVMQSANMNNSMLDSGAGQFSVSASGSLAYVRGGSTSFQSGCSSGSIERAGSSRWPCQPAPTAIRDCLLTANGLPCLRRVTATSGCTTSAEARRRASLLTDATWLRPGHPTVCASPSARQLAVRRICSGSRLTETARQSGSRPALNCTAPARGHQTAAAGVRRRRQQRKERA